MSIGIKWTLVQMQTPAKKLRPTAIAATRALGRKGTATVANSSGAVAQQALRRARRPGTPRRTHHIVSAPTANAPAAPNTDGYQLYLWLASAIVSPRSCTK